MAGIEKVCELSGEYLGWLMYSHKHNQLQVSLKCRNAFRGADHILHVFPPKTSWECKNIRWDFCEEDLNRYDPPFATVNDFIRFHKERFCSRLVKKHWFTLEVSDQKLAGQVGGRYSNSTFDLPTVKRKLKRLLRCRKLNIVIHNCSEQEYALENTLS